MHGCKNVPSTTGLCEIKARAPFPHNAMLSTGRPHDGAKKKPPSKKHVSFCSTLHCGGTGRGLLFRTNRSKKKGFLASYNTLYSSELAPRTHHGFRFPFFFGPRGGWRGLLPVNPSTFSFPLGGMSGVVVGGPVTTSVSIVPPPLSYRICPAQPFCHLPTPHAAACVYDTMYLVAFRSQNKQTNSGLGGWQRRQFPNGFRNYHTFCNILLGRENGVGGWQMPSTGVEYYRTYENCENR